MPINFDYMHPHYNARRFHSVDTGTAVSGTVARFVAQFPITFTGASYRVVTAGTGTAVNTYIVNAGGSAVGTISLGTTVGTSTGTFAVAASVAIAKGGEIYTVRGADAVGNINVAYEYYPTPFGDVTA